MSRSLFARLQRRHGRPYDGPSRREVLQGTLAAASGLLLSCAAGGRRRQAHGSSAPRVVVIGAGFAGLAAAHELASAGYDTVVVEARRRVGGRVLTFGDLVPGAHVEGGGELIGSNHPAWAGYAQRFGLRFRDVTEDDAEAPIVLAGRKLDAQESNRLWEELLAAVAGFNADARGVDADEPWKSAGAAALDRKTVAAAIEETAASALGKLALDVQAENDGGVPSARQSYLGLLAEIAGGGGEAYWTESEVYRCESGNQELALRLAAALPEGRLLLGTPVDKIGLSGDRVTLLLSDGRALEADDAVLTVPPSTFARIAFDPPLPARLAPQMGANVKQLLRLNGRFWRGEGLAPDSLSDGLTGLTWEATDNQPDVEGACLVSFAGGPAAEEARQLAPSARLPAYIEALEGMYPGIGAQCTGSRFMDWPSETWTGAGYSFPAPGEVTTVGPLLREGIGGRLHFAGEHACYAFVGYMEGALHSGAAVAKRLAVRDGLLV